MKGEMRKRLALLSILLVAGLAMAGIATAFGAGNLVKFAGKEISAVAINDQLKIYEDGKLVKEITLPEGEYTYTIKTTEISGHKIVFHKMTKEEIEKAQAEHEKEMNKWLEIVNKDSRIQELTNGKGIRKYNVITAASSKDEVVLGVGIGGKWYKITIDLNNETVKSIEEYESPSISMCYGPNGPINCSKLPLHGPRFLKHAERKMTKEEIEKAQAEHEKEMNKWLEIVNKDSRIQELTNGEGIQFKDVINAITDSGDEVILTVKVEKYYEITIDLNSERVKSMEERSSDRTEICYGPGCNK